MKFIVSAKRMSTSQFTLNSSAYKRRLKGEEGVNLSLVLGCVSPIPVNTVVTAMVSPAEVLYDLGGARVQAVEVYPLLPECRCCTQLFKIFNRNMSSWTGDLSRQTLV